MYMQRDSLCLCFYYKSKHIPTWNICEDNMPFMIPCCQRDGKKIYMKRNANIANWLLKRAKVEETYVNPIFTLAKNLTREI